jgi:hypothetical protein
MDRGGNEACYWLHYQEIIFLEIVQTVCLVFTVVTLGAGATFDWLFFDNSKLIDFDC